MSGLDGKKIALLEARMGGELARLIERRGGVPSQFPALREQTLDASSETAALIARLSSGQSPIIVFQTGVGVAALFAEAEKLGQEETLRAALRDATTVCRGPKPTAVLSRQGIKPTLNAREPFTTQELIETLSTLEVSGAFVSVLHYGERNTALAEALVARGARLDELCLYEWRLPEDLTPLVALIGEIPRGSFDAVVFTSQIQARHLFQIAEKHGQAEVLRQALNQWTTTASIGPTCSDALRALGVEPRVEPEHPKMGPLVLALDRYFEETQ
jgi:uroporphyrinogen-III synthase